VASIAHRVAGISSFGRLDELPDQLTVALRNRYDAALEALFEVATSWSVVHGDAHAGNALNVGGQAVLFDFDTACWAPSVWTSPIC
jgi:Ser/Thr protein kinase RdoA (MazF antagonist)